MRIAVLWTTLSGYLNACMKELASREGVELFVSHEVPVEQAPYDEGQFAWIQNRLVLRSPADFVPLAQRLEAFNPEIIAFCGWHVPAYRRVAKVFNNRCVRVMFMDNCWNATPKQRLGTLVASWYVRPLTDAVWVPGERQALFARKLGFEQREILWGSLSCDQPAIEAVHEARVAEKRAVPHSFLFMGRFVADKGVHRLVEAYQSYRERSSDPWPLVCCGAGPLSSFLEGRPGIRVEGFVQPDHLCRILADSGCLILPSTFEPWALVVHEAASAGLLILASDRVGAAVHLVQDNFNGYIFDGRDVKMLAALMSHISNLSDARLDAMSCASHMLSMQFTPARWADTLLEGLHRFPSRVSVR
jgi:glycosyltransferase involved in cell wall biosynthesis